MTGTKTPISSTPSWHDSCCCGHAVLKGDCIRDCHVTKCWSPLRGCLELSKVIASCRPLTANDRGSLKIYALEAVNYQSFPHPLFCEALEEINIKTAKRLHDTPYCRNRCTLISAEFSPFHCLIFWIPSMWVVNDMEQTETESVFDTSVLQQTW